MTNRLSINAIMVIGGPSQVLDDVDIQINDIRIDQIQSMKYLGIHISITNFPWIFSVTSYVPMLQPKYRCYTELDNFIRQVHLHLFTKKKIQPAFDYACSVWGHTKEGNISKLQRTQNYVARIVTGNFDYINFRSADLLYELNWASVKERGDYFTSVMMFKAINGLTTPISDRFASKSSWKTWSQYPISKSIWCPCPVP